MQASPGRALGLVLQGASPYLEQLDPDAGKHELEKGGDDHDVANCPDGHKDALDDVLGRGQQGEDGRLLLAFAVLPTERANTNQDFLHFDMIFQLYGALFFRYLCAGCYP